MPYQNCSTADATHEVVMGRSSCDKSVQPHHILSDIHLAIQQSTEVENNGGTNNNTMMIVSSSTTIQRQLLVRVPYLLDMCHLIQTTNKIHKLFPHHHHKATSSSSSAPQDGDDDGHRRQRDGSGEQLMMYKTLARWGMIRLLHLMVMSPLNPMELHNNNSTTTTSSSVGCWLMRTLILSDFPSEDAAHCFLKFEESLKNATIDSNTTTTTSLTPTPLDPAVDAMVRYTVLVEPILHQLSALGWLASSDDDDNDNEEVNIEDNNINNKWGSISVVVGKCWRSFGVPLAKRLMALHRHQVKRDLLIGNLLLGSAPDVRSVNQQVTCRKARVRKMRFWIGALTGVIAVENVVKCLLAAHTAGAVVSSALIALDQLGVIRSDFTTTPPPSSTGTVTNIDKEVASSSLGHKNWTGSGTRRGGSGGGGAFNPRNSRATTMMSNKAFIFTILGTTKLVCTTMSLHLVSCIRGQLAAEIAHDIKRCVVLMDEDYQVRIGAIDNFCAGNEKLVVEKVDTPSTSHTNNSGVGGSSFPAGYNDFGSYLNNINVDDDDEDFSVDLTAPAPLSINTNNTTSPSSSSSVLTVRDSTQWGAVLGSVLFCPRWLKLQFASTTSGDGIAASLLISRLGFSAQYGTQYRYNTSPLSTTNPTGDDNDIENNIEHLHPDGHHQHLQSTTTNPKHQTSLFSLMYQSSAAMQVLATDVALFLASGVTLVGFAIPQFVILYRIINGSLNIQQEQLITSKYHQNEVVNRVCGLAMRGYRFVVQEVLMPYPRDLLLLANKANNNQNDNNLTATPTTPSSTGTPQYTTNTTRTIKLLAATLVLSVVIPLVRTQMSSRLFPFIVRTIGHRITDHNWKSTAASSHNRRQVSHSCSSSGWYSMQISKIGLLSRLVKNSMCSRTEEEGVASTTTKQPHMSGMTPHSTGTWEDIYRQVLRHHIALYCTPWSAQHINSGGRRNFGDVKSSPWWYADIPRSLPTCRLTKELDENVDLSNGTQHHPHHHPHDIPPPSPTSQSQIQMRLSHPTCTLRTFLTLEDGNLGFYCTDATCPKCTGSAPSTTMNHHGDKTSENRNHQSQPPCTTPSTTSWSMRMIHQIMPTAIGSGWRNDWGESTFVHGLDGVEGIGGITSGYFPTYYSGLVHGITSTVAGTLQCNADMELAAHQRKGVGLLNRRGLPKNNGRGGGGGGGPRRGGGGGRGRGSSSISVQTTRRKGGRGGAGGGGNMAASTKMDPIEEFQYVTKLVNSRITTATTFHRGRPDQEGGASHIPQHHHGARSEGRGGNHRRGREEGSGEEMRGRGGARRGGRGGANPPNEPSSTLTTTPEPDDDAQHQQQPPQQLRPQHKSDAAALNVAADFLDPEELRALHASVNAGTEPLDALPSGSLRSAALSQPDVRGFVLGTEARQLYRTLRILGIEVLATFNLLRLAHRKEDFEHAQKHQDILLSSSSSSDDEHNDDDDHVGTSKKTVSTSSLSTKFWRLTAIRRLRRGVRVLYHFTLGKANSARAVYTNTIFEEWTKTLFFGVFHATAATIAITALVGRKSNNTTTSDGGGGVLLLPPRVFVTLVAYCASSLFTSLLRHCATYLLAVYNHHDNYSLFSTSTTTTSAGCGGRSSLIISTIQSSFTKSVEALLMPGTSSPSGLATLLTRQFLLRYERDERHSHTIIAPADLLLPITASNTEHAYKLWKALQIVPPQTEEVPSHVTASSTADTVGDCNVGFIHLPSHLQTSYFPQTPEELLSRIAGCKVFAIDGATSAQRHNELQFTYRRVTGAVREQMRGDGGGSRRMPPTTLSPLPPTRLAVPCPPPPFEILGGFSMKIGIYFDQVCYSYPPAAGGGTGGVGTDNNNNHGADDDHNDDDGHSNMVRYYALDGVSAFLPAKTMTGIKGASGGGKSTLMKMILKAGSGGGGGRHAGGCVYSRRWETTSKSTTRTSSSSSSSSIKYVSPSGIYIDGIPTECFNHQYLRSRIAFVPQPQIGGVALTSSPNSLQSAQNVNGDVAGLVVVYFSTIAETLAFPANAKLRYGGGSCGSSPDNDICENRPKRAITLSDVQAAAKLCNSHDLIMKLPHGYNTQLERRGTELRWKINGNIKNTTTPSSTHSHEVPSHTPSGTDPMAHFATGPPGLSPPTSSSSVGGGATTTTGGFSSGEEQRLLLTQALLFMTFCSSSSNAVGNNNSSSSSSSEMFLLLLDEPTSRLDAENEHHFVSAIHKIVGTNNNTDTTLPTTTTTTTSGKRDSLSSPHTENVVQEEKEDDSNTSTTSEVVVVGDNHNNDSGDVRGGHGGVITVVCVSHRPSTLNGASTIITVNNGQVAAI